MKLANLLRAIEKCANNAETKRALELLDESELDLLRSWARKQTGHVAAAYLLGLGEAESTRRERIGEALSNQGAES